MPNDTLFCLTGIPVPKKNSRMCFVRNGRMFNIPSARYKEWHEKAALEIRNEPIIGGEVKEICITFHFPDKRRRDISNLAESVLDLLVDMKIISDDSWQVIPALRIISAGINKEYPHTEISIYQK